jgi:nicotinamide-nucleotide amidase
MRAAILSIGSELLQGFLTDTNATFLTQELSAIGVEAVGVSQVGDDLTRIVTAFQRALSDADLVIASGGIGPTDDDLTREAVAAVCGEEPHVDEHLADQIRAFFTMRGVPMPEQNVKQAWVIPSSETLSNPMGTAPGWFVHHGDQMIVIMPGVPREMYRMWREQALPRVLERLDQQAIVSRTIKTIGIGESAVEQRLIDLVRRGYPTVATYAKDDGVHIRVTAISEGQEQAEAAVSETEDAIRRELGTHVYGHLDIPLADALLQMLKQSGNRAAIWEAGSAGRLTNLLDESTLADDVIDHAGTTSYEAAFAAAGDGDDIEHIAAFCARAAGSGASVPIGISLVVRIIPGERPDSAVGTVGIALAQPGTVVTRSHSVTANPAEIRRRATMWAADFLWSALQDATAVHPD